MSGVDPAGVVAAIEARARRWETPCGDGALVWRSWGAGPPLLLLHGSHGAWSHWIRNIDALAATYTVIAPDLPGNGESAMPSAEDHRAIADALALGLAPFAAAMPVVGFSFGGVVAAHLDAFHPAAVHRLVLVGTGGLGTPRGAVTLGRVRGLEGDARSEAHRTNLLGLMLHAPASADALAVHLQERNGWRGRLDTARLVLPDRLLRILPDVRAPVDAIWGALDRPHPDPQVQAAALRSVVPDMRFHVVPEAGHWAMYEQAAAFDRLLAAILSHERA